MRVVSFNVNSIRVRLHQLDEVFRKYQPDIVGLQETKVTDEDFPVEEINEMGYEVSFTGQKTHYGVALLSRKKPTERIIGLPNDDSDSQRRFIAGKFALSDGSTFTVINGYYPQGENRKHPTKFPAKAKFYADVLAYLEASCSPEEPLVIMGDMNVARLELDIGIGEANKKRWLQDGKTSFLPEERDWLGKIFDWGVYDTFRLHHAEVEDRFSWFDYRSRGFERNPKRGLRIDLILATNILQAANLDSGIDYEIRSMLKPSDHCPIWTEFELSLA